MHHLNRPSWGVFSTKTQPYAGCIDAQAHDEGAAQGCVLMLLGARAAATLAGSGGM
jgi:hypothetical protein